METLSNLLDQIINLEMQDSLKEKNHIIFYAVEFSANYLEKQPGFVIHELGHAFNNVFNKGAQGVPDNLLRPLVETGDDSLRIDHGNPDNYYYGYVGGWETWQYGYTGNRGSEEFADMFIGWVFNQWNSNLRSSLAKDRQDYMNNVMLQYLAIIFP